MKLNLSDKKTMTETEFNDLLELYWTQNRTIEEAVISKECLNYIKNNWFSKVPIYKKCKCCGQETGEISGWKKIKPWREIRKSDLIYNSDFMTVKITESK